LSLVAAQEANRFSLGTGIEGNMNTRQNMALGTQVSVDYGIIPNWTAGVKFTFSHNLGKIMTLEPEFFARWYVLELKELPLFAQADLGTTIIFEGAKSHPAFLGGVTAGIRIPFNNWYVEPYVRTGYPFIWGAGITAGYRF
jgi:hypothetical protein